MNDRVDEYVDGGYDYKTRRVDPMPHKSFRIGDGRISGYLSCALGILSFLAVLCFLFPSYLTTAELRAAYDVEFLKTVLMVGMIFSLVFAHAAGDISAIVVQHGPNGRKITGV